MSALLHRPEAAEYLRATWGFRISAPTLASMACRGRGPRYSVAGRNVVYSILCLDEYALAHVSHPVIAPAHDEAEAAHGA